MIHYDNNEFILSPFAWDIWDIRFYFAFSFWKDIHWTWKPGTIRRPAGFKPDISNPRLS